MIDDCDCCCFRLRNELEKQEGQHKELLAQLHNRHTSEMDEMGEQMIETENMRTTFEKEVIHTFPCFFHHRLQCCHLIMFFFNSISLFDYYYSIVIILILLLLFIYLLLFVLLLQCCYLIMFF